VAIGMHVEGQVCYSLPTLPLPLIRVTHPFTSTHGICDFRYQNLRM
jgi:hypothetical protein